MSLTYPVNLPNPTRAFHAPKPRVVSSDIPGEAAYFQREHDYTGTMDVEFFLNDTQASSFYSWWRDDLLFGGYWFSCNWPAMRPGKLICQFKTEPVITHVYNGAYRISAQVQVRGASEEVIPLASIYTSWVYPTVFRDAVDVSGSFISGSMIQWTIESLNITGAFSSGVLSSVQQTYTFWPLEALDMAGAFSSGTLAVIQVSYNFWPFEALDFAGGFTSGGLTVVQVTYNFWPVESMDITGAFVSGVLT